MRINLVRLVPENDIVRGRVFDDAVLPFYFALKRLGYRVEMVNNRLDSSALSLVFGANVDPAAAWLRRGPRCVIINLEQFRLEGAGWGRDEIYLELMAENEVWDYSLGNAAFLKNKGIEAGFFKFGYVPEMSRLAENPGGDIDVLFYGALNERRLDVIEELEMGGVKVKWLNDIYASERERAIYRSRVVMNIHSGRGANLEIIRLGYLLANRKAVASEFNADTECYPELAQACAFFPYEELARGTANLLGDARALKNQAETGFSAFSSLSLVEAIRPLLGQRCFLVGGQSPEAGEDSGPPESRDHRTGLDAGFIGEQNAPTDRFDVASEQEIAAREAEDWAFLSGPWTTWLTPDDGLKLPDKDYKSMSPRRLHLLMYAKQFKAWRYRRRVLRFAGRKKCWYMRKLDILEREIARIKTVLAASH